jgi:ADP-ribose pyrophosphatase YjhB (NUDIX family)
LAGLLRRLAPAFPSYLRLAWWGLVSPLVSEREPLVVVQAVIRSERGILLTVRRDLHGWELPGGNGNPGESAEAALVREVLEETGLDVVVERHVGDYLRTGFRPHTASVFECRVCGGTLRPSSETPLVRWFDPAELPDTLFPWYRAPLADALAPDRDPRVRREHQGLAAIWAGLSIDLRMRWSDHRAGSRGAEDDC